MTKFSLSKGERIKKKKELEGVFSSGRVFRGDFLMLRIQSSPESNHKPKFAFLLSKKIKRAVTRNRIKRLMREVVRENKDSFPRGDMVVVSASPEAQNRSLTEFQEEFLKIMEKAANRGSA